MTAIESIRKRLQRHPDLRYRVTDDTLTIDPPSPEGFSVWLSEADSKWIVGFDGWHEHFDAEEEALNCFAFGLSDQCRLQVCLRGRFPYRWTLEQLTEGVWEVESTTGLIFFPFWRRRQVEYRQNSVIKGACR